LTAVSAKRPPGLDERLLHGILGVVCGAEHPVAVSLEGSPLAIDDPAERLLVAATGGVDQRASVG
jgi:hypothetical protein